MKNMCGLKLIDKETTKDQMLMLDMNEKKRSADES